MRVLILGGDKQNYFLYKKLVSMNLSVEAWGFKLLGLKEKKKLDPGLYDLIITSIPFSLDNTSIHAPFCEHPISIKNFKLGINQHSTIVGGPFNYSDSRFIDITKNRDFIEKSITPISEEIIKIIITHMDITISDSRIEIIGEGILTERLNKILKGLGAIINSDSIPDCLVNIDHDLTTLKSKYKILEKKSVIIDASSSDEIVGKNIIKARGLAIKTAPRSIAKYLYETLLSMEIISL